MKLTNPLTDEQFIKGMKQGHFVKKPQHVGLVAFLHYSAVRISEGLRMKKEHFRVTPTILYADIGVRLKKGKRRKRLCPKCNKVNDKNAKFCKNCGRNLKGVTPLLIESKLPTTTPPLEIPADAPFVESIIDSIRATKKGKRVWPYHRSTGWRIVKRVFAYPHYHRLTRITQFFLDGYTIPQVRSWTGLSLRALNYYIGLVSISKMGASLRPKRR